MHPDAEGCTALIVPALNEEAVIGELIDAVPRSLYSTIIVADNGSTDHTAEIAASRGATIVSEPDRGYGAACLRALRALPPGIDILVFMQADLSEDPADAAKLIAPINAGRADLVIGSRVLGEIEPGALLPHQRFGNWLATTLIRLLYAHRYTDLGPFRAISRSALQRLDMHERAYGWTVEMQVRAVQLGLRILEVPVNYRRRLAGENKVSGNLTASVRAGARIIWTILRLWRRDIASRARTRA
jgi:glycosyltransferase involved in cell wall biosynthesis